MFGTSAQDLNDKKKDVRDDLTDGARRVKRDVNDTVSNIRDDVNSLRDDLSGSAQSAGRYVRDLADTAESRLSDATGSVVSTVRENPVSSTFVALGAGILIGMLIRR